MPDENRGLRWIPISEQLPGIDDRVLFYLDDPPTEVSLGWWAGKHTHGKAIAMEYGDSDGDWLPCSHWMPLPAPTAANDTQAGLRQPTLTDEERASVVIVAEWAEDHLGEDDPGVIALRALLERMT